MTDSTCSRCGFVDTNDPPRAGGCPRCLLELGLEGRDPVRFLPGQMLLKRYRIVSLLGRGGMGEVYRADDLKLGESVALKFLPSDLAREPALLDALIKEVKIARQVTHPNVCRVFDIGEVDGHHFISMEYVDGEDLASLLRRIGRLPQDKALQIARQLCAGLAAAHERGILHRDIKPANVMIDGRGWIRVTDFGLAEVDDRLGGPRARAGTLEYMAPEQRAGREVTAKSDLYALGLVLYELFTGTYPFPDGRASDPVRPSRHVRGLDPDSEALILRCLEQDPGRRPASALAAAAALPGDDPFSPVLAAGETPLPEMVATAESATGLRRRVAWACLLSIAMGFGLSVLLSRETQMTRIVPLEKSTFVLRDRAAGVAARLGYHDLPADSAEGFSYHGGGRSSSISYWYRTADEPLVPRNVSASGPTFDDPPFLRPGMVRIRLSPSGHLRSFDAIPDADHAADAGPGEVDWQALFGEANLDPARFRPLSPSWKPPVFADTRRAWEGDVAGSSPNPVRVEAAAEGGRVVAARVFETRMGPSRTERFLPNPVPSTGKFAEGGTGGWRSGSRIAYMVMLGVALAGGTLAARRNLRAGRGHRRGAFRLATFLLVVGILTSLFRMHHVATPDELNLLIVSIGIALFWSSLAWIFYMALEPYLRRIWPRTVVSWIRLLDGHLRDPLVGRHVLFGCLVGIAVALLIQLYQVIPEWVGGQPPRPERLNSPANELEALRGFRYAVASILTVFWKQTFYSVLFTCGLLTLKMVGRKDWIAVVLFSIPAVLVANPAAGHPGADLVLATVLTGVGVLVFFRLGLLALVTGLIAWHLTGCVTLTLDLTAWYAYGTVLAIGTLSALALWGFRISLAGKSLIGDVLIRG